jgi:hypothetical protein
MYFEIAIHVARPRIQSDWLKNAWARSRPSRSDGAELVY